MSSSDYSNPPTGSLSDTQASGSMLSPKVEETLRQDARSVVETAKTEFDKVAEEATTQASGLAEQAKAQIADVASKAKGLATEQKDLLVDQIGGVAEAIERVARDLEGSNASSAHYARMIADGATRLTDTVRDNDVDAIFNMAQDFGRKQPVAFMGAAALLGFAASRFLLASAKREQQRRSEPQPVDYNGTPSYGNDAREDYGSAGSSYSSDGRV